MSETTKIAWADSTGSPWFGCTEVSPGCVNCYARELTLKHKWAGWGNDSPRVRSKGFWSMARKLNKAGGHRRIFPSLMDWLDPKAPVEWLAEFLKLIQQTPNVQWLLLTKRPELWRERLYKAWVEKLCNGSSLQDHDIREWLRKWFEDGIAPENVWVGVSVEDQARANVRILPLLTIPAKIRFVSAEPLLSAIEFGAVPGGMKSCLWQQQNAKIDWVIVGGESGPDRRDCGLGSIIDIANQCLRFNVPCFVKQDCAARPGQQGRIPNDVWQVKQFPKQP